MSIDIVQPEMEKAGHAREKQGVNDIGADHDLRLKTVEQQEHHHDNAARSDRSDAHQKSSD